MERKKTKNPIENIAVFHRKRERKNFVVTNRQFIIKRIKYTKHKQCDENIKIEEYVKFWNVQCLRNFNSNNSTKNRKTFSTWFIFEREQYYIFSLSIYISNGTFLCHFRSNARISILMNGCESSSEHQLMWQLWKFLKHIFFFEKWWMTCW